MADENGDAPVAGEEELPAQPAESSEQPQGEALGEGETVAQVSEEAPVEPNTEDNTEPNTEDNTNEEACDTAPEANFNENANENPTEQTNEPDEDQVGQEEEQPADADKIEEKPEEQPKEEDPDAEEQAQSLKDGEQTEQAQEQVAKSPAEEETAAQLEDKKTPEPPTEHMATGTQEHTDQTPRAPPDTPRMEELGAKTADKPSSPSASYDKDATATVKFVLMPTQQVATLRCHLNQTLTELKEHFASELKMPAAAILLMFDGKNTNDSLTLGDLGVGPNGTIQLEMQSADPLNTPIKAFKPRQEYHMPDVITVRVQSEDAFKDVVVEIERATGKKPFLGGYRHKKTGVEYHHASAQSLQKSRQQSNVERFCRDTQTVQQRHMVQQTTNDMSTQMTKVGTYISNMEDKLVIPGKYTTADEFQANVLSRIIIIQKYYRRWLAKKNVNQVRNDKQKRLEWERQEEIRKKKEKEDRIRREYERRMNPKSKEDFDLLYHALEKWRQEELDRINSELSGAERKAALCQLLDQETQLIASVGRHQNEASSENKQKSIQAFLEKAASPKKWKGGDGKLTEMDTPYTIRAQELRDIYNSINMKYLTQDERLDVLLTLKHTVKEHDCKLTQEIIELIDREADLLMRGVKESNLDGLRKRISTLFLQYIKTPTFNPEAARLLKVPQDPSTLRKNIYYCSSCNQYLPCTEFQMSSNSKTPGKCRKCNMTDNAARVRQDYSHYRYMLKGLRRQEEVYGDGSKIAFLMQENDLRYLVENVWNSQSVLSAWDDLYDLALVRWYKHEEWAPWNCILLTKEEASAHDKLENLEEAYGKVFIHKVKHKHTLARNYFARLPGMAEHIRGKGPSSAKANGPSVSGKGLVPARA